MQSRNYFTPFLKPGNYAGTYPGRDSEAGHGHGQNFSLARFFIGCVLAVAFLSLFGAAALVGRCAVELEQYYHPEGRA